MPIVSSIELPIEADVLATTDKPLLKSPVDTEKLFDTSLILSITCSLSSAVLLNAINCEIINDAASPADICSSDMFWNLDATTASCAASWSL